MKKRFLFTVMASAIFAVPMLTSCDDDDDDNKQSGNAVITIENVAEVKDFVQSGTFRMNGNQPVILPGQSVSITFNAGKGQSLMFATMYGYSNDIFFAPENPGIELFNNDGVAVTGNVSSKVKLWDNGTRVNQVPGTEVTHPGTAESRDVTMIDGEDPQGNVFPAASELMELTLAYTSTTSEFTLTIKNISGGTVNETPFSPGVWVVSNKSGDGLVNEKPFFDPGEKSTGALTALAETGNNAPLSEWSEDRTGIITGLSPTIVVVYSGDTNPLFKTGEKSGNRGLKELAQTGDTKRLKETLELERVVRAVYIVGDSPIAPGESKETSFMAFEGDNIAFATMFGYSNDWFYANSESISSTTKGNVTAKVRLFDSGTGVDQYPGAGNSQALFGGTPATEDKVISTVGDTYPVPEVSKVIKVTLR